MKKLLTLTFALALIVCLFAFGSLTASAYYTEGDYEYTVSNNEATLTDYIGAGGDVTIPATLGGYPVTTISNYAFYRDSLTSVTIPNSVTTIDDGAFDACYSLLSINVNSKNTKYSSKDGVLFNKDKTVLIRYPVRKSGAYTIPGSVTTIGDNAFSWCPSLTSVTIPNSVTTIGDSAFYLCKSLTKVTIPDSVTTIGDSTFCSCSSLTSVTIPNSVTTIGKSAFYSCDSLTSVTIPNSVTTIGDYAFSGCIKLASVHMGKGVVIIGYDAFYDCDSLTDVYYSGDKTDKGIISIGPGNTMLLTATWHYDEDNTTTQPSTAPATQPSTAPTTQPSTAPTTQPSTAPTTQPTATPEKDESDSTTDTLLVWLIVAAIVALAAVTIAAIVVTINTLKKKK